MDKKKKEFFDNVIDKNEKNKKLFNKNYYQLRKIDKNKKTFRAIQNDLYETYYNIGRQHMHPDIVYQKTIVAKAIVELAQVEAQIVAKIKTGDLTITDIFSIHKETRGRKPKRK